MAQKIINLLQTGVKTILQLNHICSNILIGIEPILVGFNLDAAEVYAAFFNNLTVLILRLYNRSAAADSKLQIVMDACAYIFTAGNIHIVGNRFARSYLAQSGGGNGTAAAGTLIDVIFAGRGRYSGHALASLEVDMAYTVDISVDAYLIFLRHRVLGFRSSSQRNCRLVICIRQHVVGQRGGDAVQVCACVNIYVIGAEYLTISNGNLVAALQGVICFGRSCTHSTALGISSSIKGCGGFIGCCEGDILISLRRRQITAINLDAVVIGDNILACCDSNRNNAGRFKRITVIHLAVGISKRLNRACAAGTAQVCIVDIHACSIFQHVVHIININTAAAITAALQVNVMVQGIVGNVGLLAAGCDIACYVDVGIMRNIVFNFCAAGTDNGRRQGVRQNIQLIRIVGSNAQGAYTLPFAAHIGSSIGSNLILRPCSNRVEAYNTAAIAIGIIIYCTVAGAADVYSAQPVVYILFNACSLHAGRQVRLGIGPVAAAGNITAHRYAQGICRNNRSIISLKLQSVNTILLFAHINADSHIIFCISSVEACSVLTGGSSTNCFGTYVIYSIFVIIIILGSLGGYVCRNLHIISCKAAAVRNLCFYRTAGLSLGYSHTCYRQQAAGISLCLCAYCRLIGCVQAYAVAKEVGSTGYVNLAAACIRSECNNALRCSNANHATVGFCSNAVGFDRSNINRADIVVANHLIVIRLVITWFTIFGRHVGFFIYIFTGNKLAAADSYSIIAIIRSIGYQHTACYSACSCADSAYCCTAGILRFNGQRTFGAVIACSLNCATIDSNSVSAMQAVLRVGSTACESSACCYLISINLGRAILRTAKRYILTTELTAIVDSYAGLAFYIQHRNRSGNAVACDTCCHLRRSQLGVNSTLSVDLRITCCLQRRFAHLRLHACSLAAALAGFSTRTSTQVLAVAAGIFIKGHACSVSTVVTIFISNSADSSLSCNCSIRFIKDIISIKGCLFITIRSFAVAILVCSCCANRSYADVRTVAMSTESSVFHHLLNVQPFGCCYVDSSGSNLAAANFGDNACINRVHAYANGNTCSAHCISTIDKACFHNVICLRCEGALCLQVAVILHQRRNSIIQIIYSNVQATCNHAGSYAKDCCCHISLVGSVNSDITCFSRYFAAAQLSNSLAVIIHYADACATGSTHERAGSCGSSAAQRNIVNVVSSNCQTIIRALDILDCSSSFCVQLSNRNSARAGSGTISAAGCGNTVGVGGHFRLIQGSDVNAITVNGATVNHCRYISADNAGIRCQTEACTTISATAYSQRTYMAFALGSIVCCYINVCLAAVAQFSINAAIGCRGIGCAQNTVNSNRTCYAHANVSTYCHTSADCYIRQVVLRISRDDNAFASIIADYIIIILITFVDSHTCIIACCRQLCIINYAFSSTADFIVGYAHANAGLTACSHTKGTCKILQGILTLGNYGQRAVCINLGAVNRSLGIVRQQVNADVTGNTCSFGNTASYADRKNAAVRFSFGCEALNLIFTIGNSSIGISIKLVNRNTCTNRSVFSTCSNNGNGSNLALAVSSSLHSRCIILILIDIGINKLCIGILLDHSSRACATEGHITGSNGGTYGNSRQRRFIYGIDANLAIFSSGNISIIDSSLVGLLFLASTAGDIADFVVGYAAASRKFGIAACADAYRTHYCQLVAVIRGLHCHLTHIIELRTSTISFRIFAVIFINNSFYVILTLVNNNHAVQSSFGRTCGNCCADAVHVTLVGCIYSKSAACTIHATDFAALDISAGSIVQGIVGNSQACAQLGFGTGSSAYLSSNIHCQSSAFGLYISFRSNKLAVFNSCRNIVIQRLPVSTAAYAEAACSSGNTGRKACQNSMACRINVRADQSVTAALAGSCNNAILNLSIIIVVNIADSYGCSCAAAVVTGGNAYAYRAGNNHIAATGNINIGRLIAVAAFICCLLNLLQVGRAVSIEAAIFEILSLRVSRFIGIIGCNIQAFTGQCHALNRCIGIVIQFIVGGIAGESIGGIGAACYTHIGSHANLRHIGSSFDISSGDFVIGAA